MPLGPFDLPGGPFLTLYIGLLVAAITAGFLIPPWLRPDGRAARVTDADQLAYLAGGPARFADAVTSRLLSTGALVLAKGKFHYGRPDAARNGPERSVLALSTPIRWSTIEHRLGREAKAVERELVSAGLLMDRGTAWQLRFWQTTPYFLLLAFGAIKLEVGMMRERPIGYLAALMCVTAFCALLRFGHLDWRTKGGQAAVAEARERAERLRRAPAADETGLAVALFGTAVLAGSGWADFHRLRSASSGDGGGGSDGGGGGCGGGGCGGCGG